mmetsp:Transcript_3533/g.11504  ORF Transcript_3533/g.11504 Transcript_3533/m.11504 type:complete len:219 (+) Transcript_3533:91-747(+)
MPPVSAILSPCSSSATCGGIIPGVSMMYMLGLLPTWNPARCRVTPGNGPILARDRGPLLSLRPSAWPWRAATCRIALMSEDLPTLGTPTTMARSVSAPPQCSRSSPCTAARICFADLGLGAEAKTAGMPWLAKCSTTRFSRLGLARSDLFMMIIRRLFAISAPRPVLTDERGILASRSSITRSTGLRRCAISRVALAMWPGNQVVTRPPHTDMVALGA